jgi:hypothetical protein
MKRLYNWGGIFIIFLLILPRFASAQNLENIRKQKPIDISGSLSLRISTFSTTAAKSNRDPFSWTLSGNPTLSIYGITFPFSVVFSNKQKDFRQPFNMYGVSPYYKKIKFHAGYRSVYFSDYTLSDHVFLGGGIEAEPSFLRLGFVYGRFMKAVEPVTDTLSGQYAAPSFARKGFAAKIGFGDYNNFVDFIVLKIQDDTASVKVNATEIGGPAAENMVVGIKSRQVIAKIVALEVDFGVSAYTKDVSSAELTGIEYQSLLLFKPRISTQFLTAGKASLGLRIKKFSLKLNYRRVEPEYQSMGAYYYNTDIENLTLAPTWQMFRSRLRINGSIGLQRNNLFSNKANNSIRRANSLSLSLTPNSKWGISLNYSNYNTSQTRNYALVRDTLLLEQFSNNVNGNVYYNFGSKIHRQSLSINLSYLDLSDNSSRDSITNSTTSLNPSVSYRFNNTEKKFSWNISSNASRFNTDLNNTFRWGLSGGGTKTLLKNKLKLGANASFFNTRLNGIANSNTMLVGGTLGYQPHKNHSLNLNFSMINRSFAQTGRDGSTDFIGNLGYSYNF